MRIWLPKNKPILGGFTIVTEILWNGAEIGITKSFQEEPTRNELADRLQAQLKTVFFEFDKSDLSDLTRRVLQDNARILKLNPGLDVVIEGHCDDRGTIEYNLALGQRRAASVRDYLVSLGVDTGRLRTVSFGEEKPVTPGSNESSWSRNRRGEFTVE